MNLYFYRPETPSNHELIPGGLAKVAILDNDLPQFAVFSEAEVVEIKGDTVVLKVTLEKKGVHNSIQEYAKLETGYYARPQVGTQDNYEVHKSYIW